MWLLFQAAGARIVSVVTQLALARLLMPSQFGLISLVYTVTNLAGALVNFGVDGVLLQRHRTLGLWITPSFWASLALGVMGLVVVALLAPVFAHLYHAPQMTGLALLLALSMPLGALTTVPTVKLRSEMNFRFPAVYNTLENLVSQLATIVLAFLGFGALSFVLPTPILALIKAAVFWWRAPSTLAGRLRIKQIAYLMSNGMAIFGSRLSSEMISQGDYAVLGLLATHSEVGLYFFAFRLSAQPVWILAGNFTNVLFPALVQIKNDPARQLNSALRAATLLSYIVMPICFLQAAIAEPALHFFFGQRWLGSIHLAQLLSLGLPFDAVPWVAGCLLAARREFRRSLAYSMIALPCFFAIVTVGALVDKAVGVAVAVAVYYLIFGPVYSLATFIHHGGRARDVVPLYIRPPLFAAVAMGMAYAVSFEPWLATSDLLRLAEVLALGPLLYGALMWRFEPAILLEIMDKLGLGRFKRFTLLAQRT